MNHPTQNQQREQAYCCSCLESSPGGPGSRTQSQLHQLKRKLLYLALEKTSEPKLFKTLCGAANQAADLAWNTSFPLLVFPGLFEELTRMAGEQFHQGQTRVTDDSPIFPIPEEETQHDDEPATHDSAALAGFVRRKSSRRTGGMPFDFVPFISAFITRHTTNLKFRCKSSWICLNS
ncbi:MAG: hypothetical protein P4N60_18065 [Verrucomicrobiae bacterium]|nr:hypothetical protein [Verrucomicrobiae bacterium]